MKDSGGFEGNAQTLKIVTEKIHDTGEGGEGMKPSRAFIDGIMKYKILWSESDRSGKFLYDDQISYLNFLSPHETIYRERSLECSIMNWADDVAYALHDLLDGYQAGFISRKSVYEWAVKNSIQGEKERLIQRLLEPLEYKTRFERYIAARTGEFIENVSLTHSEHPLKDISNRYKYVLEIPPEIILENDLYKQVAVDLMFKSPKLEQIEFKGQYILDRIFRTFLYGDPGNFTLNRRILPEEVQIQLDQIPRNDYKQREALQENPSPEEPVPIGLSPTELMERKFLTEQGRELYKLRSQTVEPVFGQIKDIRGCDRFKRRGIGACRSEWSLVCAAHNLLKLWRSEKACWN